MIEAVEIPPGASGATGQGSENFVLAVQWHPELLDDLDPAFVWLVEEARRTA